ncbi:PREDICTED: uncharacterized protein LOC106110883 isoform X2 [Papilio polytes]|uniref:uncharacterized protein LOC106110883 isoform X2 n=1 Tax=Papilio polytes TaxID=76194 RepID=UPI0006768147|nr:PREDICTED: uncharacterized protein LOC106110883 isoform X2 [Papilio polytes]
MTDKGSFETYEYTEGNEDDQFFLVQDDGSFLSLSNRQVQYLTQGQDIKEVVNNGQPCEMFDVTSPQLLLGDNSAEDQLTLPNGETIIIADNYLLQESNTIEEQVVQQDEEPKKDKTKEVNIMHKTDDCTEITLSDEQFHTLEQKGRILLETNDKVYILDTSGLHDITTNDKLIQKFKCPEGSNDCEDDTSLSSNQDKIQLHIEGGGVKFSKEIFGDHSSYIMNINPKQHDESMEVSTLDVTNQTVNEIESDTTQNDTNNESTVDTKCEQLPSDDNENVDSKLKDILKTSKTKNLMFKVSTNIAFKDIPRKIVLGETMSGKKLFAKITKLNAIDLSVTQDSSIYEQRVFRKNVFVNNTKEKKVKKNSVSAEEQLLESVVRQWWEWREGGGGGGAGGVRCSALDVASAHTTVMQLLKIPEFKSSVLDRNIVVTKVVSEQDEQGAYSSSGQPSLVTGRVAPDARCFLHEPDMLHIINTTDDEPDIKKGDVSFIVNRKDDNVLHIHVNEMKRADNILRVSITLNIRKLPSKVISEENKRKLPGKAFACRNCAAIFNTEVELKEHQKTQCSDVEDASIDLDKLVAGYTVVFENGKDKIYHCNQCKMKFVKLHNCIKHLKTHYNSEVTNGDSSGAQAKIHKCNMCSCTFNHQQTLVKHIVNKHINI